MIRVVSENSDTMLRAETEGCVVNMQGGKLGHMEQPETGMAARQVCGEFFGGKECIAVTWSCRLTD